MANPSATTAVTNIGTSSAQVIGSDSSRRKITFHNPNATNSLIVCQATDAGNSSLAATFTSPAGGFVLFAGATQTFQGAIQGAWNAAANTGSTNALTIYVES